jgi:hypothetical protein
MVVARVVRHIQGTELSMFDDWSNIRFSKFITQAVLVLPFVSGNSL